MLSDEENQAVSNKDNQQLALRKIITLLGTIVIGLIFIGTSNGLASTLSNNKMNGDKIELAVPKLVNTSEEKVARQSNQDNLIMKESVVAQSERYQFRAKLLRNWWSTRHLHNNFGNNACFGNAPSPITNIWFSKKEREKLNS